MIISLERVVMPWSARKHLVGLQDIKCSTIMLRAINAADVPAVKEPSGLNRQDGKRPDGLSIIPWQSDKPLLWDVTVASTLAGSSTEGVCRSATELGTIHRAVFHSACSDPMAP